MKPVQIGFGYEVSKMGMDTSGNHSVWVRSLNNRAKKIQTNGNLPALHRAKVINRKTAAEILEYLGVGYLNRARKSNPALPVKWKKVEGVVQPGGIYQYGTHGIFIYPPNSERVAAQKKWLLIHGKKTVGAYPTLSAAKRAIVEIAFLKNNPIKKKKTIGRRSQITGKAPSARLKRRRAKPKIEGYFPNPSKAFDDQMRHHALKDTIHAEIITKLEALHKIMRGRANLIAKQAEASFVQGFIDCAYKTKMITKPELSRLAGMLSDIVRKY